MMKLSIMILSGLVGALALTTGARASLTDASTDATISENPYRSIWLRNAFDLKPGSVTPAEVPNPDAAPPNIKLTGITTILGNKLALFMVQEPAQHGKPAGPQESYILGEGQRRGPLEVVAINPKASTVQIRNEGTLSTITFSSDGIAGGGQKMAAAAPVPAPTPSGFQRTPTSTPGFGGRAIVAEPAGISVPSRQAQFSQDPSAAAPAGVYYDGYVGGTTAAAPVSIPTFPAPSSVTQPTIPGNPAQPDVMSQAGAAIAAAQAQAASEGHSLISSGPPVNEGIPDLPGNTTTSTSSTGTGSTASRNTPTAPTTLIIPPIPNLPTPPDLPASLQPH
jgi:hypothetical protein